MNCQKFEELVSELARGQMMYADLRREALDHASECRDCMVRLSAEERLTNNLRALKSEMENASSSSALEVRLLEAFRTREVVHPIVPKRVYTRYWLTAVAALLLIVFGVAAARWRHETKQPQKFEATGPVNTEPQQTLAKDNHSETPATEKALPAPRPRRERRTPNLVAAQTRKQPREDPVANHVVKEVATDFVPLSYLNPENIQEGGQIVRVELPRSAMATFGFPVNMDRYNEKVKADVLLGVDGVAHAIRFVKEY